MTIQDNRKVRICPFPQKPRASPSSIGLITRIRLQLNPLFLRKTGSLLLLIGGILILAAQVWIILLALQFAVVWAFDPTLVMEINFPMMMAALFGSISGMLILLGAIVAYFKNIKIGTFLAIFWALLANIFLAFLLLIRMEIPYYVFFLPFWQTLSVGTIGASICIIGGGFGMASLRRPQPVPTDIVYEASRLRTAGWVFTLIGAAVILVVQLLLMYWFLEYFLLNPAYPYGMDYLILSNLHLTGIGTFATLCCGIALIITAFTTASINAKLGGILTFLFAIPAFLPIYWSMLQPLYLVLLQGAGAAYATAGGTLSLSAGLAPYQQPVPANSLINQ